MTGRPEIDDRIIDEALAWHQALDRDDVDWDAYALWLEADPVHRHAIDEIALTGRIVDAHADGLQPRHPTETELAPRPTVSRRGWLYGSIAAALALVVGVPAFWPHAQPDAIYATARGETRQVTLAQGIVVDLSSATQLVAKGGDPTRLELAQGAAYFQVAHDPQRTLSIKAGDYSVQDIGTAFSLNLTTEAVAVAVAEGQLSVAAQDAQPTKVSAGEQLIAARGAQSARVMPVRTTDVGSWRRGRLIYNNTPLGIVAADIARYSGKTITVDPAISNRPFSGVLAIGDGSRLLVNLSDLMPIS